MARRAVRLPALSRPRRAGISKFRWPKSGEAPAGTSQRNCPYQNRVGMARRAVRIAERQRQAMLLERTERHRPRYHARSALATLTGGDIAAQCPYQNRVGTVRCAVRLPALSRPRRAGFSKFRWPKSGEAPAGTSQRGCPCHVPATPIALAHDFFRAYSRP